jgi:hypothetical protein
MQSVFFVKEEVDGITVAELNRYSADSTKKKKRSPQSFGFEMKSKKAKKLRKLRLEKFIKHID